MAIELYHLPTGGSRAAGVFPTVVVGCGCVFVLTLWAGTQTVAAWWSYAPVLGRPISVPSLRLAPLLFDLALIAAVLTVVLAVWTPTRGWAVPVGFLAVYGYALSTMPVYAPWQILLWWARYHWAPQSAPIWAAAARRMTVVSCVGVLWVMVVAIQKAKQIGGQSDLYGSAAFGDEHQLRTAGLLSGHGLFVGMWPQRRWGRERMVALQDHGPEPVLITGPNRSGKTVGVSMPNALTWEESLLVLDPKGEIWRHSAGYRRQQGSVCLQLNPTAPDGTTAHWNPLLEMPAPPSDVAFAQTIAQAIMETEEFTKADETALHFRHTAENLLRGVILHVWYAEANKSLEGCLQLLTNPLKPLAETLEHMRTAEHDPAGRYGWRDTTGQPTKTHPVVAAAARAVENQAPNERTSTVSTAVAYFNLYHDPIVAQNTRTSDFRVQDLIDPTMPPVSLYLTIPTPELARLKPFVRILLYHLFQALTAELPDPTQNWTALSRQGRWLLLLMDEFPLLGHMRLFHDTLPVMASYGIKVVLLAQDLTQIHRAYGKDEHITGNCRIQVAFAPNRMETAQWLSAKTGMRTVSKQQRTYTGNRFAWYLPHVIASEQEVKRELLTPDEVMRLPESLQLLFAQGRPFLTHKIVYYRDLELGRRAQMPAPVESNRIEQEQGSSLTTDEAWWKEVQS